MSNTFLKNVVFGSMPIGNINDISINMINHICEADIILTERLQVLSNLMADLRSVYWKLGLYGISPNATIYQYQVESEKFKFNDINSILINEAKNNKKILVVSDEGNSLFLEPMVIFKDVLLKNNIEYQVLPGPNSVISAVVSGKYNPEDFCFGGNYEWIGESRKKNIINAVIFAKMPVVFILRAIGLREMLQDMLLYFDDNWFVDLGINLSMENEQHFYGNLNETFEYVNVNNWIWQEESQNKKIIITLFPSNYYELL